MLKLYSGITPNLNKDCYYYTDFNAFLNALEPYFVADVEDNTYIPETNYLIQISGQYSNVSYIIDTTNTEQPYCYWVRDIKFVSGYYNITVEHDYFAEYIYKANFGNINFLQGKLTDYIGLMNFTQTPIGIPVYSQINDLFDPYDGAFNALAIVFNVEFSYAKTTLFTNESLTQNKLFVKNTTPENLYTDLVNITNIITFSELVSATTEQECAVTRIWVVPQKVTENIGIIRQCNFWYNYINNEGAITKGSLTLPSLKFGRYEINRTITNLNYNKKYFYGTKDKYLDLVVYSDLTAQVRHVFNFSSSKISIEIYQGDKAIDLSTEFEFNTTSNNGTFTQQEKTANSLQNIFGLVANVTSTASSIATENVAGVISGVGSSITSFGNMFLPVSGRVNYKNVDGWVTWGEIYNNAILETPIYSNNPFYLISYDTAEEYEENENGYNYGINTPYISTILASRLIDYVRIDTPYLQGIPINAIETIQNKFSQGINLKVV